MAFDASNLSALAYANGFTLWHYKTSDAATAVRATGYFNASANMLRVGDMVLANVAGGDAVGESGIFVVLSNTGGVVDVGDMVSFVTNDAD